MSISLSPVQVQGLLSIKDAVTDGASLTAGSPRLVMGDPGIRVSHSTPDMDSLVAKLRTEINDVRLAASRSRLSVALAQLAALSEEFKANVEDMKSAGEELIAAERTRDADRADFDVKNAGLEEKKAALDAAEGDGVESAQRDYDSAKAARDESMMRLESSEAAVAEKQGRFDSLVDSLDAFTGSALREALKLDVSDVDHLHEEIDEDDKTHSLAEMRSVEDLISDALKRLDGEIAKEVEDRHLDHV